MGDLVTRMKRQAIDWEEIFVIYITDKGQVSRIYKGFSKVNRKNKQIIPLEHGQRYTKHC